jgi:hypothetical protein
MRRWIVGLLIGIACLVVGTGVSINNGDIKCGNDVMTPGTTCQTTINVFSSKKTYEQMLAERGEGAQKFDSFGRWVFLGVGVALTALSGYKLSVALRARRKKADDATAEQPGRAGGAGSYPGQQQQYPGQPGHPGAPGPYPGQPGAAGRYPASTRRSPRR